MKPPFFFKFRVVSVTRTTVIVKIETQSAVVYVEVDTKVGYASATAHTCNGVVA